MGDEILKRFEKAIGDLVPKSPATPAASSAVGGEVNHAGTHSLRLPIGPSLSAAGASTTFAAGALATLPTPTSSPPICRPWDRGDLLRRLATFKSTTWFGKPQVAGPVECARRGWVNIDADFLACEGCGARLSFPVLASWPRSQVERAAEEFAVKLESGHRELCAWQGNACSESLAQFPPTPASGLVAGYNDRCEALLQLKSLPVIAETAVEHMKLLRPAQVGHLLSLSSSPTTGFPRGVEVCEGSAGKEVDAYWQSQRLIAVCGWEPRMLPYAMDCEDRYPDRPQSNIAAGGSASLWEGRGLGAFPGFPKRIPVSTINTRSETAVVGGKRIGKSLLEPPREQKKDGGSGLPVGRDRATAVLDCSLCGASVGMWNFQMLPRLGSRGEAEEHIFTLPQVPSEFGPRTSAADPSPTFVVPVRPGVSATSGVAGWGSRRVGIGNLHDTRGKESMALARSQHKLPAAEGSAPVEAPVAGPAEGSKGNDAAENMDKDWQAEAVADAIITPVNKEGKGEGGGMTEDEGEVGAEETNAVPGEPVAAEIGCRAGRSEGNNLSPSIAPVVQGLDLKLTIAGGPPPTMAEFGAPVFGVFALNQMPAFGSAPRPLGNVRMCAMSIESRGPNDVEEGTAGSTLETPRSRMKLSADSAEGMVFEQEVDGADEADAEVEGGAAARKGPRAEPSVKRKRDDFTEDVPNAGPLSAAGTNVAMLEGGEQVQNAEGEEEGHCRPKRQRGAQNQSVLLGWRHNRPRARDVPRASSVNATNTDYSNKQENSVESVDNLPHDGHGFQENSNGNDADEEADSGADEDRVRPSISRDFSRDACEQFEQTEGEALGSVFEARARAREDAGRGGGGRTESVEPDSSQAVHGARRVMAQESTHYGGCMAVMPTTGGTSAAPHRQHSPLVPAELLPDDVVAGGDISLSKSGEGGGEGNGEGEGEERDTNIAVVSTGTGEYGYGGGAASVGMMVAACGAASVGMGDGRGGSVGGGEGSRGGWGLSQEAEGGEGADYEGGEGLEGDGEDNFFGEGGGSVIRASDSAGGDADFVADVMDAATETAGGTGGTAATQGLEGGAGIIGSTAGGANAVVRSRHGSATLRGVNAHENLSRYRDQGAHSRNFRMPRNRIVAGGGGGEGGDGDNEGGGGKEGNSGKVNNDVGKKMEEDANLHPSDEAEQPMAPASRQGSVLRDEGEGQAGTKETEESKEGSAGVASPRILQAILGSPVRGVEERIEQGGELGRRQEVQDPVGTGTAALFPDSQQALVPNFIRPSAATVVPCMASPTEFDPIRQHRHFCPWVNANASAAPDGEASSGGDWLLCGWQQCLLAVDAAAHEQSERPAHLPPSESTASRFKGDPVATIRKLLQGNMVHRTSNSHHG